MLKREPNDECQASSASGGPMSSADRLMVELRLAQQYYAYSLEYRALANARRLTVAAACESGIVAGASDWAAWQLEQAKLCDRDAVRCHRLAVAAVLGWWE
jgi:hypothetical protein